MIVPLTVVLFAAAVVYKASLAVAPPLYDALSYYWKALSIARAISEGGWDRLMQLPPANRPPGVLPLYGMLGVMGGPYQYRAFFAVNMILPVVLWAIALWIAVPVRSIRPADRWRRGTLVAALSLIPMFLQFEYDPEVPQGAYWGMQDTALASVSALALALIARALRQSSIGLAGAGFALSAFTVLIKPSGLLVMMCCTGLWVAEGLLRWKLSDTDARKAQCRTVLVWGLLIGMVVQSVATAGAYFSPYLSKQVVETAMAAQAVAIDMFGKGGVGASLVELCRASLGVAWATALIAVLPIVAIMLVQRRKRSGTIALGRLVYAVIVMVAALYWWLYMAGPVPRYMYPFVCMFIVLSAPSLWIGWRMGVRNAVGRHASLALAAVAATQVALVAIPARLPASIEWNLGTCLGTGQHADCVAAGKLIVEGTADMPKPVVWMQVDMHERLALIGSWLRLRNLEAGRAFRIEEPFAWKAGNVLSRAQILSARVLVRDKSREGKLPETGFEVSTFERELEVLNSWLGTLDRQDGVREEAVGNIVVMWVEDRAALARAFDTLVLGSGLVWRPEFLAHNYANAGIDAR